MNAAERSCYRRDPSLLPREKLIDFGPDALSDAELISLILGSGQRGRKVNEIAVSLEHVLSGGSRMPAFTELISVPGIGAAKAARLCAAFELGHRVFMPRGVRIGGPEDAYGVVKHISDRKQEHFLILSLNGAHELIRTVLVCIGLVNRTVVHPREVFAPALEDRAAAIIAAHNHPSGNVEPSSDDTEVTNRLRKAGSILGIRLLDHIIFGSSQFYSFADSGLLS